MGSLLRASLSLRFASVHLGAPRGSPVNSGSREFTRAPLGVVGFNRVRVVSLERD